MRRPNYPKVNVARRLVRAALLFLPWKVFPHLKADLCSVALLERMDFSLSKSSVSHRKKFFSPFHKKAAGQLWWHLWKLTASRRVISITENAQTDGHLSRRRIVQMRKSFFIFFSQSEQLEMFSILSFECTCALCEAEKVIIESLHQIIW